MAAKNPRNKLSKRKIMLLENDLAVSATLKQIIAERGHGVVCAATAEEAMSLLRDTVFIGSSFDGLLANYHLDDSSALRIIRDFRHEFKTAPVGLMTAQSDIATAIWARSKGIPLLEKPVRRLEILAWLSGVEQLSA